MTQRKEGSCMNSNDPLMRPPLQTQKQRGHKVLRLLFKIQIKIRNKIVHFNDFWQPLVGENANEPRTRNWLQNGDKKDHQEMNPGRNCVRNLLSSIHSSSVFYKGWIRALQKGHLLMHQSAFCYQAKSSFSKASQAAAAAAGYLASNSISLLRQEKRRIESPWNL